MNKNLNYLITLYQHNETYGDKLLRVAIQLKDGVLSDEAEQYPMSFTDEFKKQLPLHVREIGPIVEIATLFDVLKEAK